ncbi:MAG TPA: PH domain-containing protein [Pseudonocardiaceae bacterium]|nr:PH domain-containing protein [Pseudonocardiaceae bacterium]
MTAPVVRAADEEQWWTRSSGGRGGTVPYPEDLLMDDERIVLHKHPHWKMLVLPVVLFLLIVALCGFFAAVIEGRSWERNGWIALGVLGGIGVVWLTVVPLLRWRTTHFVLTTKRVLVREGILTRSGIDIPINRINSVQFRHNVIERILGCGTLIIESAADEPLEFDDIPQVERVHSLLYYDVNAGPWTSER